MFDYNAARINMVNTQIHPEGVFEPSILEAFKAIPRELFLPEDKRQSTYRDEEVPIGKDRFLLAPALCARMMQALEPKPSDVALDIGGGTGYTASIFASLVSTVIALEDNPKYTAYAERKWAELDACNIVSCEGPLNKGNPENAPFDIIFLNGAVSDISMDLLNQLSVGGRLIAPVKKAGELVAHVTIVRSLGEDGFSGAPLFEAGCDYLSGFEPLSEFSFS